MKRFIPFEISFIFLFISSSAFCNITEKIQIKGNYRIKNHTILFYSNLKKKTKHSISDFNNALKKLFKTGHFNDVTLIENKETTSILVKENAIVNKITIRGNLSIKDKNLKKQLKLKENDVYTPLFLQHDMFYLNKIYRSKGNFSIQIIPSIIRNNKDRLDITFLIREKKNNIISRISFVGATIFNQKTLEEIIKTKKGDSYQLIKKQYSHNPSFIEIDKKFLYQLYLKFGYIDFEIKSVLSELQSDDESFFLTFNLHEGERYRIEKIILESRIKGIRKEELQQFLTILPNDWYSIKNVKKSIKIINHYFSQSNLNFAYMYPEIKKTNKIFPGVSIKIIFYNKIPTYIDTIFIVNNSQIDNDIIRRKISLIESDKFDMKKLKKSKRHLINLGFLRDISIKKKKSTISKVNLLINIDPKPSTGEVVVSGGFQSLLGILLEFRIGERNFLGRGQEIETKFKFAKNFREIDFTFIEPYFLNKLQIGINIYRGREKKRGGFAKKKNFGGKVFIGYELLENLYQTFTFHIRQEKSKKLNKKISPLLRSTKGIAHKSIISQKITYDKLNNRLNPSDGYLLEVNNILIGVYGEEYYLNNILKSEFYKSIQKKIILSFKGNVGFLIDIKKTIRPSDRYELGGNSLRGFDFNGIGPRDRKTGNALRGKKFYLGNIEIDFPVGLPNEFGIRASIFSDFGNLWKSGNFGSRVNKNKSIRISIGFGVNWKSPFGPMRFDFAWPLQKNPGDKTRKFLLGFNTGI